MTRHVDSRSLFIDVQALAGVLASSAWPAARCLEVFQRFFARENVYAVDAPDLDAFREILKAAKAERPSELPAMMDAICALMDWSDVDKRRDSTRVPYVLRDIAGWSLNLSAARDPRPGLWLAMNPADLACLLHIVDAPLEERGEWAAKIVRALEWGDEAAMSAVRARIASVAGEDRGYLVWDTTDEIEARTFDLVTSGFDDGARALWPFKEPMYSSSALRACVSYFTMRSGAPRPSLKFKNKNEHSARDRAEYAAFIKASFPALFGAAILKLLEANKFYAPSLRAICEEVADEETKDNGKTTWRLGDVIVSHSGDPKRGRWAFKKIDPPKPKKVSGAAKPKIVAK